MREENQKSIAQWADRTFGTTVPGCAADRALVEMKEFKRAVNSLDFEEALEEAADVTMVLFRFANAMGRDLMKEISRKMAVNRQRDWIPDGKGNGRHVKR